jgi:O-antigen ligase
VGPDAPSIVDAPGWIKLMPCGHSGYLDTIVDMGYVGLVFLIIFILTTLHALGRVVDRDPTRGWFLLSIVFYVILTNLIETAMMQGYNALWLMFLFVAAETGRFCKYFSPRATFGPVHTPPSKKALPA